MISWANLAQAELRIADAWIKHLPPTVPVRAGYMTLTNDGDANVSVVAARSAAFASVEIHETLAKDGMMQMQHIETLDVAAGATVKLAPGGLHMMLMQPVAPTEPGLGIELNEEVIAAHPYTTGGRLHLEMTHTPLDSNNQRLVTDL